MLPTFNMELDDILSDCSLDGIQLGQPETPFVGLEDISLYTHNNNISNNTQRSDQVSSPFDLADFPENLEAMEQFIFAEEMMENSSSLNTEYSLTLPVIKVDDFSAGDAIKVEVETDEGMGESQEEETEEMGSITDGEEEEISVTDLEEEEEEEGKAGLLLQPLRNQKYSSTESESDEDWQPEMAEVHLTSSRRRRRPHLSSRNRTTKTRTRRVSSSSNSSSSGTSPRRHPIIPQQRAPGTKLKITQWLVTRLRDPASNPSVITWEEEERGVFRVEDSAMLAKLWGEVKENRKMTYEKLSRAMRYSYKNAELEIFDRRLTYRFGPNMLDCRARDPKDPNFRKLHSKQKV